MQEGMLLLLVHFYVQGWQLGTKSQS